MNTALGWLGAATLLFGSSAANADVDYGFGPTTYYLHRGSSYQQGCWGPCACVLSNREPMVGTFILELVNIGDVTDFYALRDVSWTVPRLAGQNAGITLTGSGTFAAGQHPYATHQSMMLNLTVTPPPFGETNPQQFLSEFGDRTVPPPVIDIELANSTTGCPGVRLRIVASAFRSDWNADARSSVQDLFDFLADYFSGRGDHTGDGTTSVEDIFAFLADLLIGA